MTGIIAFISQQHHRRQQYAHLYFLAQPRIQIIPHAPAMTQPTLITWQEQRATKQAGWVKVRNQRPDGFEPTSSSRGRRAWAQHFVLFVWEDKSVQYWSGSFTFGESLLLQLRQSPLAFDNNINMNAPWHATWQCECSDEKTLISWLEIVLYERYEPMMVMVPRQRVLCGTPLRGGSGPHRTHTHTRDLNSQPGEDQTRRCCVGTQLARTHTHTHTHKLELTDPWGPD